MVSRVTPTEVKVIITTTLTDPTIQIWIDGANAIVNENASCINGDEDLLKKIELNLSAHFIGMLNPAIRGFVTREKLEVFDTSYSNPVTLKNNIDNTPYGTAANMLSKGCLANTSDKRASVGFF